MVCPTNIGVKNVLITFIDCDTGQTIPKVSHNVSSDSEFTVKTCAYDNEAMTGGKVKRVRGNATMTLNIDRITGIPLSYYQGCAALDVQVEMFSGIVYTGYSGTVVDPEESDSNSVSMSLVFAEIDEMRTSTVAAA